MSKKKRIMASVIAIILVLSLVLSLVAGLMAYYQARKERRRKPPLLLFAGFVMRADIESAPTGDGKIRRGRFHIGP